MARKTETTSFQAFSEKVVHISWLLRVHREQAYSSALVQRELSEKAVLALWLLSLANRLPLAGVARFLRLSSERAENTLRTATEEGFLEIEQPEPPIDEKGKQPERRTVRITPKGRKHLDTIVREGAKRYQKLVGVEPPADLLPKMDAYVLDVQRRLLDNLSFQLFQVIDGSK